MKTEQRLDKLTGWLSALAPWLAQPKPNPLVQSLLTDIEAWASINPETDPAILSARAKVADARAALRAAAEARAKEAMKLKGPPLWKQFHERTLSAKGDDSAWLRRFVLSVHCGDCRRNFLQILQRIPPRWDDYFAWGVEVHNEVNKSLGAPLLSIEAARDLYPKA